MSKYTRYKLRVAIIVIIAIAIGIPAIVFLWIEASDQHIAILIVASILIALVLTGFAYTFIDMAKDDLDKSIREQDKDDEE